MIQTWLRSPALSITSSVSLGQLFNEKEHNLSPRMALGLLPDVTPPPCQLLRHTWLCGRTQKGRVLFLKGVSEVPAIYPRQVLPGPAAASS